MRKGTNVPICRCTNSNQNGSRYTKHGIRMHLLFLAWCSKNCHLLRKARQFRSRKAITNPLFLRHNRGAKERAFSNHVCDSGKIPLSCVGNAPGALPVYPRCTSRVLGASRMTETDEK